MRRLIAYIVVAFTILVSMAAAFVPVFTQINGGLSFSGGREYTYQLVNWEDSDDDINDDSEASREMAGVMETRLATWGLTEYDVRVEGNDMITVKFSASNDLEYERINNYLSFSNSLSIATTDDEFNLIGDEIFLDSTARLEYNGIAPVVILPISNTTGFKSLVDHGVSLETPQDTGDPNAEPVTPDPSIVLWSNRIEGEDLYADRDSNPLVAEKIVNVFSANNIYYTESAVEETEIQWVFLPEATDETGSSTTVEAVQRAYDEAVYYLNMLNASTTQYEVESLFYQDVQPTIEALINFSDTKSIALSATLISSLVAIILVSLILVLFYRLGSIAIITTSGASVFLSLLVFILFGAEFNIATLFGALLVGIMSLFAGIFYNKKFHDEVYKGRSYKKANIEASKKVTLPIVDVSIIAFIFGIVLYFLGGSTIANLGVMLVIGSVVTILMGLIVLKIMMYLVTNTTSLYNNHKVFNIETKYVVNQLEENKNEVHEGSFANVDFTKKSKMHAIINGALLLVATAGLIVFSALNSNFYNTEESLKESTKLYITTDTISSPIDSVEYVEDNIIANIMIDGEKLEAVEVFTETREVYNDDTELTETYYYYVAVIDGKFDDVANSTYTYGSTTSSEEPLQDTFTNFIGEIDGNAVAQVKTVYVVNVVPSNTAIIVATIVSMVGAAIYMMLRYKVSRVKTITLIGLSSGVTVIGLISLVRIPTSPITTLAIVGIGFVAFITSLFVLNRDKELLKENKAKSIDDRFDSISKAVSQNVAIMLVFLVTMIIVGISLFAFGPNEYSLLYGAFVVGVSYTVLLIINLLPWLSKLVDIVMSKIRLPKLSFKKKRSKNVKKVKSGEPEEAVFIGIND